MNVGQSTSKHGNCGHFWLLEKFRVDIWRRVQGITHEYDDVLGNKKEGNHRGRGDISKHEKDSLQTNLLQLSLLNFDHKP